MDRLSVLLTRFGFSTETFFHGQFCGSKHFPARPSTGHLHLVRQGAVGFRHDDGTLLQVDEPSLVLYPGPYAHGLEVGPEPAQLLCATIHLRGDDASIRIALPPCIRIRLRQLPSLAGTLDMLFDEAEHGASGHKLVLDRLGEILLIRLLRHAFESNLVSAGQLSGLSDGALSKAVLAMHDQPGARWTVASLAATCGMSRSKFARQFHAVIGVTPADYLSGQRILRAQALLRRGMQVQEIAWEVGYGSQPAFTRAFRAHLGLSPREWLAQDAATAARDRALTR